MIHCESLSLGWLLGSRMTCCHCARRRLGAQWRRGGSIMPDPLPPRIGPTWWVLQRGRSRSLDYVQCNAADQCLPLPRTRIPSTRTLIGELVDRKCSSVVQTTMHVYWSSLLSLIGLSCDRRTQTCCFGFGISSPGLVKLADVPRDRTECFPSFSSCSPPDAAVPGSATRDHLAMVVYQ